MRYRNSNGVHKNKCGSLPPHFTLSLGLATNTKMKRSQKCLKVGSVQRSSYMQLIGPGPIDRWKNVMKKNVVRLTCYRKGGRCYV